MPPQVDSSLGSIAVIVQTMAREASMALVTRAFVELMTYWLTIRCGAPTAISMLRFASVWYLPVLVFEDHRFLFLGAAILAALSDWLDGELARRWDCVSKIGSVADLLGDKGLCVTLMVLGIGIWDFAWWFVYPCAILVLYHAVVMGLRFLGWVRVRSSNVAKVKMFVEATGLIACFASFSLGQTFVWADLVGLFLLWSATVMAGWSMLEYLGYVPDWPARFYPRKI